MFLIKGTLSNGKTVKMKSEASSLFEAATEFFNKLSGAAKAEANKMPSLTFRYKDSAQESFAIADAPAPKAKAAKPAKK
jgi:ribosome-binding factor A